MNYNFDEIIDRKNTNALNTDGFRGYIFHAGPEKKFPFADEEFIRMWVADMEFAVAPEIRTAIKERIDKGILGYTAVLDDSYYNIFLAWCKKQYDWEFKKEELTFSPGIVPAISGLIEIIVNNNEKMMITTPSYGAFKTAANYSNANLVCSELISDNGYFKIDFEDIEKKAADPNMKLLLWCNPHNPTGRMWSEKELNKLADIVERHNLWVISDEIHCDIVRGGKKHIPLGKVMPEYNKLITCMAASKTFNIAGLMHSNIIIRDPDLRKKYRKSEKMGNMVNPISLEANKAAYECGEEWMIEMRGYLDLNFEYVKEFLALNLPKAVFEVPEATYLAWVDFSKCLPDVSNMPDFFANEAGVLLEGGNDLFVGNAKGHVRLNLAMPKAIVEEGMKRIADAIKKHNTNK